MKPFIPYEEELERILTLEKGQTFVIVRPVEPQPLEDTIRHEKADGETWLFFDGGNPPLHHYRKNPFGKEGEEFFIQEEWGTGSRPCPFDGWSDGIEYKIDEEFLIDDIEDLSLYKVKPPEDFCFDEIQGWQPASTMPQWASRRTIRNAGTECKRCWDISKEDAELMGYRDTSDFTRGPEIPIGDGFSIQQCGGATRADGHFQIDWIARYGNQYPWEGNPWAFLTTMEVK